MSRNEPSPVVAIIVAGGVGRRLRAKVRKSFVPLAGRPMLAWTLAAFERAWGVAAVVLVVHRQDVAAAQRLAARRWFRKVVRIVPGGASRMESVGCGLRALPSEARWVIVHDGARPLVTPTLIESALRQARRSRAAIAAVPVVPTIKEARGGWVKGTLDRRRLWAVQTPQAFERELLERAHARGRADGTEATDDAALVERIGGRVKIVMGSPRNIKVTTPEDLIVAEALLIRRSRVRRFTGSRVEKASHS